MTKNNNTNSYTDFENVILEVDTQPCTLYEFIKVNVIEEPQITVEELTTILRLEVGETWSNGMGADVKRIK